MCDSDPEAARRCFDETGVEAFTDLGEALKWGPDGVVVATPPASHLSVAETALASKAHVLIEKPISHSSKNLKELLERAKSEERDIYVVCNMRFHPAVEAMRRRLPDVGRPLYAHAFYGNYLPDMRPGVDYRSLYAVDPDQGGGVLFDSVHEIDYLTWFFGGVEAVSCEKGSIGDLGLAAEDYAHICLTHRNGVRSSIQYDYLRRAKRRGCEIVGVDGILAWISEGKKPEDCTVRLYRHGENSWRDVYRDEDMDTASPYIDLMTHFLRAINGQDTRLLSGRGGWASLDVVLAARESAASGARIRLS